MKTVAMRKMIRIFRDDQGSELFFSHHAPLNPRLILPLSLDTDK
jgi:hypothetical protein